MSLDAVALQSRKLYRLLIIYGIIIISFNLRPSITSVGPLVGMIRDHVGLPNWSAGLLTSMPLIAFAIMSPIAPKISHRFSNERAMLTGLILLAVGICIRSISLTPFLMIGTFVIGLGIAVLNVLLPSFIKEKFPTKMGIWTSVYTTTMTIIAATASAISVPLAKNLNLGWQVTLLLWIIPALIGIVLLLFLSMNTSKENTYIEKKEKSRKNRMWTSPLAWQVAIYMGLQSTLFYITITWLPEILHDQGLSLQKAGLMLSFTQFIGIPATFVIPVIAEKFKTQIGIVTALSLCLIAGFGGVLWGTSTFIFFASIILIGFGLSGTFALALILFAIRSRSAEDAADLSGMCQSFGYILAAFGPIFIGFLHDLTHSWTIPLLTIMAVSLFVCFFGIGASRDRYV